MQNRFFIKTRKTRVLPGFFSQVPETRVLKFCPELETLITDIGDGIKDKMRPTDLSKMTIEM